MRDCSEAFGKFYKDCVALTHGERKDMHERRNANRTRIKKRLADAQKPRPIGMHSQGSYSMWTMVQDANCDYDIDDGIYFRSDALVGDRGGVMTPLQVRQMICDAAQDGRFNRAPEVLTHCVRVYYNEGYHVDLPSYREIEKRDYWGNVTRTYELASSAWKPSDPRAVTRWFKEANADLSPDYDTTDGQFRRVVRYLKAFARSRPSWKGVTATGFMITKLAADNFSAAKGRDDEALRETMKRIKSKLSWDQEVSHPLPALNSNINKEGDSRPEHFRARLEENLVHLECLDHSDCTHQEAMKAWDKVFNRSWFCNQPEPKESSSGSQPTAAVGKSSGHGYA